MADLSLSLPSEPVAVSPEVSDSIAVPGACASCGATLAGEFCHACGQRVRRGRFTVRGIFAHLVTDAFDLNRGLLFTAVELFRRPGHAIREYVEGATVRYANPVKYLVVCVAVTVFLTTQLGVTREMAGGFTEELGPGAAAAAERVSEGIGRYMNVIMAAAVPFMAAVSRLLFRRAGLNCAEHLIFNVYVYSQQCLLLLPFLPLTAVANRSGWPMLAYALVSTVYYAWAATAFFRARPVPTFLRATVAAVVGSAVYFILLGVAMALAMKATGVV